MDKQHDHDLEWLFKIYAARYEEMKSGDGKRGKRTAVLKHSRGSMAAIVCMLHDEIRGRDALVEACKGMLAAIDAARPFGKISTLELAGDCRKMETALALAKKGG